MSKEKTENEHKNKMDFSSSKALYIRLLAHVKPYKKVFAFSIFCTIIMALTEPAVAALFKPLLDGSFIEKDMDTIKLMPLALIGIFVVRGVMGYGSNMAIQWVATRVVLDLRNEMFERLLVLPNHYYDDNTTGSIVSKITYNVEQVAAASTQVLITLVRDSVTIIGLLAWMLYLNWQLTLMISLLGPIIALIVNIISKRLRSLSHSIQSSMGDMTHVLEETIHNQKVVKLYGGQEYEAKRFYKVSNEMRQFFMKRVSTSSLNSPIGQFILVLGLAGILYYTSLQSLTDDSITAGSFISFIAAVAMLLSPLKNLIRINELLQPGLAAAQTVFALNDEDKEPDFGETHANKLQGAITFDNVSFSYAENLPPVLNNISIDIKPGETIALVGPSGGGKTTLANLLPRFYNHTQGSIKIDGVDIKEMTLKDLRYNIALVSQEVALFNDSVKANIAYGDLKSASDEQINAAVKAAHADVFINEMGDGINTLIGENGLRLSGGQRQRLAIARALVKDAPILILDEATSALDNESERYIKDALDTLTENRTTLVIAHRLSTVENADRILVMQEGNIVEAGKHDELMEQQGVYYQLYQSDLA